MILGRPTGYPPKKSTSRGSSEKLTCRSKLPAAFDIQKKKTTSGRCYGMARWGDRCFFLEEKVQNERLGSYVWEMKYKNDEL